ncbi:MAG: hypothetical protein JXQ96_17760 [Cyclobacteriaceae bacterium]
MFVLFSLAPSILLFALAVQKTQLKKIFLYSNATITFLTSIIIYRNEPLGQYINSVEIRDENNHKEIFKVVKEDYKVHISIGKFQNISKIDSINWLKIGMRDMVETTLESSELVWTSTDSKFEISRLLKSINAKNADYLITGNFELLDNEFQVNFKLTDRYDTEVINTTIVSKDIFDIINEITSRVLDSIEYPTSVNRVRKVLIEELFTSNHESAKSYFQAQTDLYTYENTNLHIVKNLRRSVMLDSSNVLANWLLAKVLAATGSNKAMDKASVVIKKGLPFRHKLTDDKEMAYLIDYYRFINDKKYIDLAKKLISLFPENFYKSYRAIEILLSDNQYFEEVLSYFQKMYSHFDFDKKSELFFYLSYSGDERLIQIISNEIDKDPLNEKWKIILAFYKYAKADFEEASHLLSEIELLNPDLSEFVQFFRENMYNYDLVELSGEYNQGLYTRSFYRNKYGVPFVVFSYVNNQFPIFIVDEKTIAYNGWNVSLNPLYDSILLDQNNQIYALKKSNGTIAYLENAELNKLITSKHKHNFDKDLAMIRMILKYPKHRYLINYKDYLDSRSKHSFNFHHILGDYEDYYKIYKIDSKIYLQDYKGMDYELLPLNDSVFFYDKRYTTKLTHETIEDTAYLGFYEQYYETDSPKLIQRLKMVNFKH